MYDNRYLMNLLITNVMYLDEFLKFIKIYQIYKVTIASKKFYNIIPERSLFPKLQSICGVSESL